MADHVSTAADSASAHDRVHASVGHLYAAAASDSFGFIEQADGGPGGAVASSAIFTDVATSGLYLGSYRRGDTVPLGFSTPAIPDSPPIAIVLNSSSAQVFAGMMPAADRTRKNFALPLFVNLSFGPGKFYLYYHSVVAGQSTLNQGSFDVVAGGDSGGSILSMYSLDRAEVRCVIAQLEDGHLVLGRNPATQA